MRKKGTRQSLKHLDQEAPLLKLFLTEFLPSCRVTARPPPTQHPQTTTTASAVTASVVTVTATASVVTATVTASVVTATVTASVVTATVSVAAETATAATATALGNLSMKQWPVTEQFPLSVHGYSGLMITFLGNNLCIFFLRQRILIYFKKESMHKWI